MAVDTVSAAQLIRDAFNDNAFDRLVASARRLTQLFKNHAVGIDEDTADLLVGHCGINGEVGNGLYFPFWHYGEKIEAADESERSAQIEKFLEACDSQSQWARFSEYRFNGEFREQAAHETKITALDRCHDGLRQWLARQDHMDEPARAEFESELGAFWAESEKIKWIINEVRRIHGTEPLMN